MKRKKLKVLKKYPKQQCVVQGCARYCVGKGDTCKRHGGDPIIKENLLKESEMTSLVLRTTKYKPREHPLEFIRLSKEGMSVVEIAAEFGVASGTIKDWSEKYLDFNTAFDIGIALHEAWWLAQGKGNLDNRNYNVQLFKFLTGNKLGYSEKTESKNLNIHAGVLQVPQQQSISDWEADNGSSTDRKE